jgi:glycosyltransferase involved in cell wall biosynthesis
LKIVFDHQIFCRQTFGGISRYFVELAQRISKDPAFDVSVLALKNRNEYLSYCEDSIVVGKNPLWIPRLEDRWKKISPFLAQTMMKFKNPDIVHETYYSSERRAPKNSKIVLTVFDMIHELFPAEFAPQDKTSQQKLNAVRRADHIVCISKQTRDDLVRLFKVPLEKTSIIYLGFDLLGKIERKMLRLEKPFLLYVGHRSGYKNFDRLLQAFAHSSSLNKSFDLLCFGGSSFTAQEVQRMSQLQLPAGAVRHIVGNDETLSELYMSAHAFIYPSLYEGFGIPPLEAMSFGCPVACSNQGSIPEVVSDAAIFFDPYEVESIQTAIEKLVFDKNMIQALVAKGKERLQSFSWELCADQTKRVYKSLE